MTKHEIHEALAKQLEENLTKRGSRHGVTPEMDILLLSVAEVLATLFSSHERETVDLVKQVATRYQHPPEAVALELLKLLIQGGAVNPGRPDDSN